MQAATKTPPRSAGKTRQKTGLIGYIYLRVSDKRQGEGDGLERQKAASLAYCRQHGLTPQIITDEGFSAYHEDHIKRGGFGQLLTAIDEGRVAPGHHVIIESFDRVSRGGIEALFTTVLKFSKAGLTAVTMSNGKAYPPGSVDNLAEFLEVGMQGSRGNEESAQKGKRVSAASENFCKDWIAKRPTRFPKLPAGSDPVWVTWDEQTSRFELNEKADTVRMILQWFSEGHGLVKITRRLEASGLVLLSDKAITQTKAVRSMLHSTALTGERHATFGERQAQHAAEKHREVQPPRSYVLPDYYPRILTDTEFADLQHQLRIRKDQRRNSKGEIPGILTGTGILKCGYCQRPMAAHNAMTLARSRAGDSEAMPNDSMRRVICLSRTSVSPCPVKGTCSVAHIERAIMSYCSNSFNLKSLFAVSGELVPAAVSLKQKTGELNETREKIKEVMQAMLRRPLRAYENMLAELEDKEQQQQREVEQLDYDVRKMSAAEPSTADAWEAVRHDALALDPEARLKARRLVEDTFESIQVYIRGFDGETPDDIGIEARSKAGQQLKLTIDRRTGEWKEGEVGDVKNLERMPRSKSARAAVPDVPVKPRRRVS